MSASEREYALRLTPDRALESLDEAAEWIEERGLATLMPCCSLPSLFAACHEEPYAPGSPGFGQWPKTKYWWGSALADRPGIHRLRAHRGKALLVAERIARLADPLCRAALADAEQGPHARLVAHLAAAGPSLLPELKEELGLDTKGLRRARGALERMGAVVSREVVVEPHRHMSELRRWDQLFPEPSPGGGIDELVLAGVQAAVIAPEREIRSWFTWPAESAVERLVEAGRLVRVEGGLACA
jgi:hypothetical protein